MKKTIWFALGLACSAPAFAQPLPAPAASPLARAVVEQILPPGTFKKLMSGTLSQIMGQVGDQFSTLPIRDFVKASGADPALAARMSPATVGQVMAIIDPAYRQRHKLMMEAMFNQMGDFLASKEPLIREGYVQAFTARFTPDQLADLKAFFETPTGKLYASQQMLIGLDPAVMGKMQAIMPEMIKAMPNMLAKAMQATAGLPPVRKASDLTPAEREQIVKLLGLTQGTGSQ